MDSKLIDIDIIIFGTIGSIVFNTRISRFYMMSIKENLGLVYLIIPYLIPVKNKIGLMLSILKGSSKHTVKLKNHFTIKFNSSDFITMQNFLGALTYSTTYSFTNNKQLNISFDLKNNFIIPIKKLTYEDSNLLGLLFLGTKYGANFVLDDFPTENFRDKTFRILEFKGKKIIETSNGIKFYIDSIHVGNTIIETFVKNIHLINSQDDWTNKVIIDVGAECGDTPLYFASKGARVYAFEPVESHFKAMIRNIDLNPHLSNNIIPINAAIGKDGLLKFYESMKAEGSSGASFIYNNQGKDFKITEVIGYTLQSAIKTFNIKHVDLLKMDCKGCEFLLTEDSLKNVDKIKIEYTIHSNDHKLENLLNILKKAEFNYVIYRHSDNNRMSNKISANIYATKLKNITPTKQTLFK